LIFLNISCGHEALETLSEQAAYHSSFANANKFGALAFSAFLYPTDIDRPFSNPKNSSLLEVVIYALAESVVGANS